MSEWTSQIIDELPIDLLDGDRSSRYPKRSEYLDYSEIIFLNADSISSGVLDISKVNYLSDTTYESITKGRLEIGDLVLTMRGNGVGQVAYYGVNKRGLINAQMLIVRPDKRYINSQYLFYYFSNPLFQHELRGYVSGSAQPQLTMTHLKRVPITLPPLDEQRAIAHILGSLDDKIEANRRMNETLEATARAIFKSWFVDFDPVHAKARGQHPPGMDAETAALFPDSFEDSVLGWIPRGWGVGTFDSWINIIGGGTPNTSTPEYWNGTIPWFSVKDVPPEGDVFVIGTEKKITDAGVNNSSAKVLPELTTIITARGTVGKLALVGVPMAMNQSCYAVRGEFDHADYFVYFQLKNLITELQQQTHGTVFDTITRATFSNIMTVTPTLNIIFAFESLAEPLLEQIRNNNFQSRTLAETRDALLPRLVSGEIRVPHP